MYRRALGRSVILTNTVVSRATVGVAETGVFVRTVAWTGRRNNAGSTCVGDPELYRKTGGKRVFVRQMNLLNNKKEQDEYE